ncbi:DUF2267 domain-containing protein [Nocardioidaceae bacterium SCSIO 66511]|nr:DUF2267 domain-containing protein [Nocardioidaceae bacterium SCSIO 66511]
MKYKEILKEVKQRADLPDEDAAAAATFATLDTLGERLAGNEPTNLADQLPAEFRDVLIRHAGEPQKYDLDEFFRRIAERQRDGCTRAEAETHAHAVLATIGSFVSHGEMDDLRRQLPPEYEPIIG